MKKKSHYITPTIEVIKLDNEIALSLESTPPIGPDKTLNIYFLDSINNNLFIA